MHIGACTRFTCQPPILRADTDTGTPFSLSERLSTLPMCDMLTRHRRARPDRTAYQGPHRAISAPLHVSARSRMTTRSARTGASASAVAVLLGLRDHITVCRTATVANEETHAPTFTHTTGHERSEARARSVGKGGHVDACTPEVHMGQQPRPHTALFSRSDQKT